MSNLLIPRREIFTRQPQGAVGIDWSNPITRGLSVVWSAATDLVRTSDGKPITYTPGGVGQAITSFGRARSFADLGSGNLRVSAPPEGDKITVFWVGGHIQNTYGRIFSTYNGAGVGKYDIYFDGAGALVFQDFRATNSGDWYIPVSSFITTDAKPFAVSYDGSATSNTPSVYTEGVKISGVALGNTPSGVQVPSSGKFGIGTRPDSTARMMSGRLALMLRFDRVLSDAEIESLSDNPWQVFAPRKTRLFVPVSAGGGSVSLVVADALHGHAADSPSFSMATYLAVAESLHAHAADNLTLSATGAANLVVQESTHAHIADGIALTTNWLLSIAEALHGHAADGLALTSQAYLAVAEALHGHVAENLTLDTSNATFLTVQEAAHNHGTDSLGLSLNTWLAIVDAAHAHTADAPTLSASTALLIAEALHAHYADALVLSIPGSGGSYPTAAEIAAAVLAALNATTIPVNATHLNGAPVIGTGTVGDDWRGVGVPPQ